MHYKSSPEDVEIIRNPDIDPNDLDAISALDSSIRVIGFDQLCEYEPEIARLLDHPVHVIRSDAISLLLSTWSIEKYLDQAIIMLRNDPHYSVRTDVARTLASYAEDHKEKKDSILRILVQALLAYHKDLDEIDIEYMQAACWTSIVKILNDHPMPSYHAPDPFDLERDVDWDLIKPYMDKKHEQE